MSIVNHEYEVVDYRIEVRVNGARDSEVEPIVLKQGEMWENEVSFTPEVAGKEQKVEFWLYKNAESEPCLKPLRLWVDVVE